MRPYELIIFDCDGVLVDSERLVVRVEAQIPTSLGWPMGEAEVVEHFVGRSAQYMHTRIEQHLGRPVDWELEFETPCRDVFRRELLPVAGITDALRALEAQRCVASSGTHDKIRFSLALTGLLEFFEGRIFSVEDVSRGKPAPDLFLHAARSMGASAAACAVVEDSPAGVEAALAAGMSVLAFAGGVVPAERLQREGITVFASMRDLPKLLREGAG